MSNYKCRHCGKIATKEPCQHCGRHDRLEHISGPIGRAMSAAITARYMRAVRAINSTANPTRDQWAELEEAEADLMRREDFQRR